VVVDVDDDVVVVVVVLYVVVVVVDVFLTSISLSSPPCLHLTASSSGVEPLWSRGFMSSWGRLRAYVGYKHKRYYNAILS
jgi:hypothetical protein